MNSSLLEVDEAIVYPEETTTDSRGNVIKRPSQTPVTVRCIITANRSGRRAEVGSDNQLVASGWAFASRDAPLGPWSRVVWRGRSFTVTNGPMPVGPTTSSVHHIAATLIEER